MRNKLYKYIEWLLLNKPLCRNSDRILVWEVWRKQGMIGYTGESYISYNNFMIAKSVGTIVRTRRKIIENYKKKGRGGLVMPTKSIEKNRRAKANFYKGQYVYQEEI